MLSNTLRLATRARPPAPVFANFGKRFLSSSSESLVEVSLADVRETATRAILFHGYSKEEAPVILDVLMYAQMRGNNQGLVKLVGPPPFTKSKNASQIQVVKDTKLSSKIDGAQNSPFVVENMAVERCIEKAKQNMFGIVSTFNTNGSNGALGYYGQKIANQNLIGFLFAQSPEFVSPFGSSEPIFGTNPVCIAIPGQGDGYVLDMATASIALYGVVEAKTAQKTLPSGLCLDALGQETTDPNLVLSGGSIRTFGGHKGSHLALMVELLAGALSGSAVTDKKKAGNWGNTVMCFDPELVGDIEGFKERVETVATRVKNAQRLPGFKKVPLPGERGDQTARNTESRGTLFLEPKLWNIVQQQADSYQG